MNETILKISHLRKDFGSNRVLKDVDFQVERGDVTCIIGASGSGKSTLLRCINLLETPTSGEILFHGQSILTGKVDQCAYRAKVGMVFQSFNLFNNMTVLENCMVGQIKVLKKDKETARKRAMEYLGHPHILTQTVRHGRRIGHTIGIPTGNLVPPPHVLVPGDGVYIARVCLMDGSSYAAVTNVGTRPTVNNGSDLTVESWMLDFDGDLYGQSIRVEFYKRLRDEIRFDSLDALKAEIQRNADDARTYFANKA